MQFEDTWCPSGACTERIRIPVVDAGDAASQNWWTTKPTVALQSLLFRILWSFRDWIVSMPYAKTNAETYLGKRHRSHLHNSCDMCSWKDSSKQKAFEAQTKARRLCVCPDTVCHSARAWNSDPMGTRSRCSALQAITQALSELPSQCRDPNWLGLGVGKQWLDWCNGPSHHIGAEFPRVFCYCSILFRSLDFRVPFSWSLFRPSLRWEM